MHVVEAGRNRGGLQRVSEMIDHDAVIRTRGTLYSFLLSFQTI